MFTPISQNKGGKGGAEKMILPFLAALLAGAIIYYYAGSLQRIADLEKQLQDTSVLLSGIEAALNAEGIKIEAKREEISPGGIGQGKNELGAELAFSRETREIGQDVSGIFINSVRTGDHGGFFRFVFDIAGVEGKTPKSRAALVGGEQKIFLEISGVSQDTGLQQALIGRAANFGDETVKSITGKFVSQQRAQYEILMSKDAAFKLQALEGPVRVVLDIEK